MTYVYTWMYANVMKKPITKASKRIKIAVYLDPEQKVALEELSERTRVPWADYVREGVDVVLAKYTTRKGSRK
jgi:hypothetical protein